MDFVKLPVRSWSPFIGKFVVVVAVAIAVGYGMTSSAAEKQALLAGLTPDSYMANYETYRASLVRRERSLALNTLGGLVMMTGIFALYEVLGFAIGALVDRVRRALSRPGVDLREP